MQEYQDRYFKKAKKEGALSRAFYKLEQLDAKHRLFSPGAAVLDLGCAPGSWLQYAAKRVGPKGKVVGVDRKPAAAGLAPWVRVILGDMFATEVEGKFDIVLSDAAPNTTGERIVDQQNSLALAGRAFHIAKQVLKPRGHCVVKIFQGPDTKGLWEEFRNSFEKIHIEKPDSSRKESFEVYWVGLYFLAA